MSTSLMTPPANPTTAARTTTPNRSSVARTAANPPLRPNTNVPARLRTRISVGLKPSGTSIGTQRMPLALEREQAGPVRQETVVTTGAWAASLVQQLEIAGVDGHGLVGV